MTHCLYFIFHWILIIHVTNTNRIPTHGLAGGAVAPLLLALVDETPRFVNFLQDGIMSGIGGIDAVHLSVDGDRECNAPLLPTVFLT